MIISMQHYPTKRKMRSDLCWKIKNRRTNSYYFLKARRAAILTTTGKTSGVHLHDHKHATLSAQKKRRDQIVVARLAILCIKLYNCLKARRAVIWITAGKTSGVTRIITQPERVEQNLPIKTTIWLLCAFKKINELLKPSFPPSRTYSWAQRITVPLKIKMQDINNGCCFKTYAVFY